MTLDKLNNIFCFNFGKKFIITNNTKESKQEIYINENKHNNGKNIIKSDEIPN